MRFIVACLACACLLILGAEVDAQNNLRKKIGGGQYKRIHQRLLDQITEGETAKAAEELRRLAKQFPDDAETHCRAAVPKGTTLWSKPGSRAAALHIQSDWARITGPVRRGRSRRAAVEFAVSVDSPAINCERFKSCRRSC